MIRAGTCSWTEKTLIKSSEFYPKEVKSAEDRLRHYAGFFDTVEVDSSYYAIPDLGNAAAWAVRTPDNFIFHVKAFGGLTGHGVDPRTLPAEVFRSLSASDRVRRYVFIKEPELLKIIGWRFSESLAPLVTAQKLGVIVFQFPPWFRYSYDNLALIPSYASLVNGLPAAVEFRHGSWLSSGRAEQVLGFLRKQNITYITADEPQYGNLATIPFLPAVTTDVAYFRFHGRNKENWLKRNAETSLRYDYLYNDNELNGFIPPILGTGKRAKVVFAMFNNCHGASAVKNARRLQQLLKNKGAVKH